MMGNKSRLRIWQPSVVAAVFVLAGVAFAQEQSDEERIAELIEQLKDEERREGATFELISIGTTAAEALVQAIRGGGEGALESLAALGNMGPPGAELSILRALVDYQNDTHGEHKFAAMHALGSLAPFAGRPLAEIHSGLRLLPDDQLEFGVLSYRAYYRSNVDGLGTEEELVEHLRANLVHEREVAAEALFHRRSVSSVPALIEALQEGKSYARTPPVMRNADGSTIQLSDNFRETTSRILVWLARNDPRIAPAYAYRLIHHPVTLIRRESARALGGFGSQSGGFVEDLVKAIQDSAPVAREAITALGMIGPAAKDAIPTLEKLTEHADPQIAERAKAALRQIGAT